MPKWNIPTIIEKNRRVVLALVLAILVAFSFFPFVVTEDFVASEERKALEQHNEAAKSQVAEALDDARTITRAIALTLKTENTQASFKRSADPLIADGSYLSIGLIDAQREQDNFIYSAGRLSGTTAHLDARTQQELDTMTVSNLTRSWVARDQNIPRLVMLQGAIGPVGTVIYSEIALSRLSSNHGAELLGFDDAARQDLYAGLKVDPDQLITSNNRTVGEGAHQAQRTFQSGAADFLIVSTQASPLLGGFKRELPWILLFGGFVVSLIVTGLLRQAFIRNEEVLRVANERDAESLAILDAAHEAFVSFRMDGTVLRWSNMASTLFGWTRVEALGRHGSEVFLHPDTLESVDGLQGFFEIALLNKGAESRLELTARRKDGTDLPIEITLWLGTFNGEPSIKTLSRDVSEQQKIMQELTRSRAEALDASRLKSEFLANMSHEIRTPMNGVIGMTDLLLQTRLDNDQREYAETVRTSADSLLTVINDILDFSKIEAGKLNIEEADFDLRAAVNSSVHVVADLASKKGIELVCSIDEDVPITVAGDRHRLRQVLINLLSNGVKFTQKGEVLLSVSMIESGLDYSLVRFDVTDTGIGIPEQKQSRIFESFEQVDMSATRRHEGTGLGLAIAKQLATLMGGEIGFQSKEGVGSSFWFSARLTNRQPVVVNEQNDAVELCDMRVLVVDDNATNRTMVSKLVGTWKMRPTEVANAHDAFREVKKAVSDKDPFRLLLLDFHMPEEDGASLARRIVEDDDIEKPCVVLLTSARDALTHERLDELNVAAAMNKPISHDALRRTIMSALVREERSVAQTALPSTKPEVPVGTRVLVAEDHPVNRRVASLILSQAGCEVDVVMTGVQAVEAIKRNRYSLVFMDCQMPEMDGYEATRLIRASETAGEHLPIVALTASAMKGDREKAIAAGMDDHLPKPVRSSEIIAFLNKWAHTSISGGASAGNATSNANNSNKSTDSPAIELDEQVTQGAGTGSETTELTDIKPSFDEAVLDNLRVAFGGNINHLQSILDQFVTQARLDVSALREACDKGDLDSLERISHKMKGGSGTVGATEVVETAARIEASVQDPSTSRRLIENLDQAVERAANEVEEIVRNHPSTTRT